MRLLLVLLLAAFGFAPATGSRPARWLDGRAAERVREAGRIDPFAERAPPLRAPLRALAREGRTPPPPRHAAGGGGLLAEAPVARPRLGGVEAHPAADPPRRDGADRGRQPEGRGPPGSPRAA